MYPATGKNTFVLYVRQCWGYVTFWYGSVSQTPDPNPFFSDLKDAKKKLLFFQFFFSYNLPADTMSSVLKIKFFAKILCVKFYFESIISVYSTPL
jgi:hypothetical protein